MKKRHIIYLTAILFIFIFCGCGKEKFPGKFKLGWPKSKARTKQKFALPASKETVLATINNRTISVEDFNEYVRSLNAEIEASKNIPEAVKADNLIKTEDDKKRLLDVMVERELLIDEAIDRGLNRDREIMKTVKTLEDQLLFAKIIEAEKDKIIITNDEIKNYYDLYQEAFVIPEERKVEMIVLPSEEKAKELLILLLQGANFSSLARIHSTDISKQTGGDIGFIVKRTPFPQPTKKTMFTKFEEIAFSLEKDKFSTVFKGPDGYYIIRITEIKPSRKRQLKEVYNDIERGLIQKQQEESLKILIGNLRKKANIIIQEKLLKD